jgi:hypothetical protein
MRRGFALVLAGVLMVGFTACSGDDDDAAGTNNNSSNDTPAESVPRGVVKTYEGLNRTHVDHRVDYPQTPPVGGDHAGVWQTCGFYGKPIVTEAGVHSLEHGAVWITFRPDLPAQQVALIQTFAEQPYVLASPWAGGDLPAPVVLSAWGAQVQLDSLPSPAAADFITKYRQSVDAPEPGAPCDGGTTFTEGE